MISLSRYMKGMSILELEKLPNRMLHSIYKDFYLYGKASENGNNQLEELQEEMEDNM